MIDLHCHLLPGIDDGPRDEASTVALARAQLEAGVRTVVCTPHVSEWHDNDAEGIAAGVERTRSALDAAGVALEIRPGAEVGLVRAIELDDAALTSLRLAGGEWLLLEAPLDPAAGVERAVRAVAARGHRILLAHPERCPAFQREPAALRRLVEDGVVLSQVTASALTGAFGARVERFARELLGAGLVHVVASDAHDAIGRPPGLREHVLDGGHGELADWLTEAVPAAIVTGRPPPPRPVGLKNA